MTEMITSYNRALTTPGLTATWAFGTVLDLAKAAKNRTAFDDDWLSHRLYVQHEAVMSILGVDGLMEAIPA